MSVPAGSFEIVDIAGAKKQTPDFGEITKDNIYTILDRIDTNLGGLSDETVKTYFQQLKKSGAKLDPVESIEVSFALDKKSIKIDTIQYIFDLFRKNKEVK